MSRADLKPLERILGYTFAQPELLKRALTHTSVSANGSTGERDTYERLEFLGDRVLGLAIAEMLDEHLPIAPEGDLSRRLNRLVNGDTCAEIAREIGLDRFLKITGGGPTVSVLGDACESVIGAVYRDGGFPAARQFIERFWRLRLEGMSGPLRDAKTELQEWAHKRGFHTPSYVEMFRSGPDHAPEFEIEVSVGTVPPERGRGRSKREAEHDAAALVLRREGVWSVG